MNIGLSTSCFYPLETEKSLMHVGKSGAKLTEIFFNAEEELEKDFVMKLKRQKDYYGIKVKSVHPAFSLTDSFMLFSNYERRLVKGLDTYKRYGEIAEMLGASYVILHGGKPNKILNDEEYFERYMLVKENVKSGGNATLLQENVKRFRAGNLDFLVKMRDYLKDDAEFCIDTKQCLRNGYAPIEPLIKLNKNIKHLHISGASRENDCMLPNKGDMDFYFFFKMVNSLGIKADAIVEIYRDAYGEYSELYSSFAEFAKFIDKKINLT